MRRTRRWISLSLVVLVLVGGAASGCSSSGSSDDDGPKLSQDDAIAALMGQGYSQEGAQCILENAPKQNVDIYSFLARDQATEREIDAMTTVGAFCIKKFGINGTTLPPTTAAP